jgi:hypothetical protein
MMSGNRSGPNRLHKTTSGPTSRRAVLGSTSLLALGLMSGRTLGQPKQGEADATKRTDTPLGNIQERMEKSRAFSERMAKADSMEERQQIMFEQRMWQRQRAVEDLKEQLRLSDPEWSVVKSRLQVVYDLVHPVARMGRSEAPPTEVEQRSRDLRGVLQEDNPAVDQIKAKLTALRVAKREAAQELVKPRRELRRIMNLRQEAVLVLNGLLD